MFHEDQFDNSSMVIKNVIASFWILREFFDFILMKSLNLLHDNHWIKQLKGDDKSIKFYKKEVSAPFKVQEEVPWDKSQ